MKPGIKQAVTGALAGAANGFSVPAGDCFGAAFTRWLHMDQKKAFATSVAVILPLSAISLAVYFWKGGLDLGGALPYLLGGLAGGLLSGKLFDKVPVTLLRRVLGLLILYGGIRAVLLL